MLKRKQRPQHDVVVIKCLWEQLVHDQGLAERINGLKLVDVSDIFDGNRADAAESIEGARHCCEGVQLGSVRVRNSMN